MLITKNIRFANDWYQSGSRSLRVANRIARSTGDQDKYMRRHGGAGTYRVCYKTGSKKPSGKGNWLKFGSYRVPDYPGDQSNYYNAAVTLRSGRQIMICRRSFRAVFGTSRAGWIWIRKAKP